VSTDARVCRNRAAQQILQPGMTFVDAGANWDTSRSGASGRSPAVVLSIEVDLRACRTLKASVARNNLDS
jgi:hypothetical protein